MRRLAVTVLCIAVGACNSHTVINSHLPAAASILESHDAVVLLGRGNGLAQIGDSEFVRCLGDGLEGSDHQFRVIREDEFSDAMYPWFESTTAPTDVTMLSALFENDAVAEQFERLAVRYLIWIEGETEMLDSRGGISCSVSPGGGGCFGFKSWDDEAEYTATIWDLDERSATGKVGTRTKGTSYLPAFVLPVPLLARVKGTACHAMASQIVDHFKQ